MYSRGHTVCFLGVGTERRSGRRRAALPLPYRDWLAGTSQRDLPDPDELVTVSGKEGLTISRPCKGETLGRVSTGTTSTHLRPQLLNHVLALEVPDLDGGSCGCAQPVAVGGEGERVDGVSMVQGVQVLPIIQVPEHGLGVLATAGAQRAVGGHGDGVQVSSVADVVGLQLAVSQVPHLDVLVPTRGHND